MPHTDSLQRPIWDKGNGIAGGDGRHHTRQARSCLYPTHIPMREKTPAADRTVVAVFRRASYSRLTDVRRPGNFTFLHFGSFLSLVRIIFVLESFQIDISGSQSNAYKSTFHISVKKPRGEEGRLPST